MFLGYFYRCVLFCFISCRALQCYSVETITIKRGHYDPIPIAINTFDFKSTEDQSTAREITQIISNDLKSSGIARPIPSAAFIEKKIGVLSQPLFQVWRQINANFLLNGSITRTSGSKIRVDFVLWDIILEKVVDSSSFELSSKLWRRAAHKIADKVYERITGDKGYFDTKIVYICETGNPLKRIKRVAIMDYDGANHQYLTDGRYLVLTPRFSPQSDKIMYLSYANRKPRVYMRNLRTGKEALVGNFPGMSFAPQFSKNSNKAIMSIASDGSTHIYEIDFQSMRSKKLTDGFGINTSPSYSPDGSKIVFNSDRSGSRQLYIMNSDGSNVERISFGNGSYATPKWSPRGDYIAFTKITKSEGFTIGVMNANNTCDSRERIIASGYLVEGPCWASNGRTIIFTKAQPPQGKKAGASNLYMIDLTGYNERIINTPYFASDPEWSNILN